MFRLKIKDWRIRENRLGSFSQYELVIDCQLEGSEKDVQISAVVRSDEEAKDIYEDIAYVVNAGNATVENPT